MEIPGDDSDSSVVDHQSKTLRLRSSEFAYLSLTTYFN